MIYGFKYLNRNVVKATIDALMKMRDARAVAEQRGVDISKVFNG